MRGPDKKPRNVVAVKTGLYVRSRNGLRRRDGRVRLLVRKMRAAMPWLEDSDFPACRGWAELEILTRTVFTDLQAKGIFNKQGEARRLLNDYRQLRLAQLAYERELGMTPLARVELKAHSTQAALDLPARFARDRNRDEEEDEARVAEKETGEPA